MILFTFGEEHEETPAIPSVGRRGWRWVFEVGLFYVGLQRQVIFHDGKAGWYSGSGDYFNVNLNKNFLLGGYHAYYDGPHCSFSIGWLHFNWSYW